MKVHELDWGVVLATGSAEDLEFEQFKSHLSRRGIVCAPTRIGGKVIYGARLVPKPDIGLVPVPMTEEPDADLTRIAAPLSGLILVPNNIWKKLNGLPPLSPNGGYSIFLALSLKTYWPGIIRYVSTKLPVVDMPDLSLEKDSVFDIYFAHAAYFSPEIFEYIWKPMLLTRGYVSELGEIFQSDIFKAERKWFQENRVHAEEVFFRRALGSHIDDLLEVDEASGKAVPRTQAGYVAYEARRSPGREWRADKGRLTRHITHLVNYLTEKKLDLSKLRLLDIGSRDGAYLEEMAGRGLKLENIQGIEISPWSAGHARSQGRPVHTGDMHDLSKFGDNAFGVVTSWHSLEHAHTPTRVLEEIYRVLKPDGTLMVVVPIERTGISLAGDHCVAVRSPEMIINLVKDAGFRCVDFSMLRYQFTGFFVLDETK